MKNELTQKATGSKPSNSNIGTSNQKKCKKNHIINSTNDRNQNTPFKNNYKYYCSQFHHKKDTE